MKLNEASKDVGFLWHPNAGVKALVEKNLTGAWTKNGCSIYLWAHRLEDESPTGGRLAVLPGVGFAQKVQQIHSDVFSFEDAVARLKSRPIQQKCIFYTWD